MQQDQMIVLDGPGGVAHMLFTLLQMQAEIGEALNAFKDKNGVPTKHKYDEMLGEIEKAMFGGDEEEPDDGEMVSAEQIEAAKKPKGAEQIVEDLKKGKK